MMAREIENEHASASFSGSLKTNGESSSRWISFIRCLSHEHYAAAWPGEMENFFLQLVIAYDCEKIS